MRGLTGKTSCLQQCRGHCEALRISYAKSSKRQMRGKRDVQCVAVTMHARRYTHEICTRELLLLFGLTVPVAHLVALRHIPCGAGGAVQTSVDYNTHS